LCRDERKWVFLAEEEKKRVTNNKLMEYVELTFLIRLYEAIGFLGRNLRFSDSWVDIHIQLPDLGKYAFLDCANILNSVG